MKHLKNTLSVTLSLALASAFLLPVHAEDYSDEEAWYKKCTQVQTSQEGVDACLGFQEYQQQKKDKLAENIKNFSSSIDELNKSVEEMETLAEEQKALREELEGAIAAQEESIEELTSNIETTTQEIAQKEEEIARWDAQIKKRMQSEQAATGTNQVIDLIMGSKGLADLLRRLTGIERITASDQNQIETLNEMKRQLEFSRTELERLKKDAEDQKAVLEENRQQAKDLEDSYNALVTEYEKKKSELEAQRRLAQNDMNSIKDFVISASLSSGMDYSSVPSVSGFINPVPAGRTSAGTWAYPGGGLHLGMDRAAPVGSELVAPASGLIIFASNTQPSNSGFLGNWSGYPAGSGNCIEMLAQVGGTLYAISFAHLSNTFYVSAGQTVSQGQVLALTGNSGNSSGAHTHIEIYNLGSMSMADAVARFQASGDTAFGTGWGTTSTACEATGSSPCRERPEKFFS